MTILVTGSRGRVAGSVVRQLRVAGQRVRAASRDPRAVRLPAGVAVVPADLARPRECGPALDGVRAVFLYAERGGLGGFVERAGAAGVKRVVLLSTRSADPAAADVIARAHGAAERAVAGSGIAWTFLRCGGFASNTLRWAETVRAHGVVREPFPDSQSALIHEDDIAAVAVQALTEPGHESATYTLTGPESLTVWRQAELIGAAVGRPVRVERQDLDSYRQAMGRTWPPDVLEARIRRLAALADRPDATTDTVRAVTGRPPRTFAEWAGGHAADFLDSPDGR